MEADIAEVLASEEYLADKLEDEAEEGMGSIVGGVYMDDQLNLIDVPGEWDAELGPRGGNLRLSMADIHTGVRHFMGLWWNWREPGVRGECAWRFQDVGTYRSLRHPDGGGGDLRSTPSLRMQECLHT